MPSKFKEISLNAWFLGLISILMVGSITMNVSNFMGDVQDNAESIESSQKDVRDLQEAFNNSALLIADLAKRLDKLEEEG